MTIFRVKCIEIYTGQKKFTRALPVTNMRFAIIKSHISPSQLREVCLHLQVLHLLHTKHSIDWGYLIHGICDNIINKYGNMMIVISNEWSYGHSGDLVIAGSTKYEEKQWKLKEKMSNSWVQSCEDNVGDVLKQISRLGLYCLFWRSHWW